MQSPRDNSTWPVEDSVRRVDHPRSRRRDCPVRDEDPSVRPLEGGCRVDAAASPAL